MKKYSHLDKLQLTNDSGIIFNGSNGSDNDTPSPFNLSNNISDYLKKNVTDGAHLEFEMIYMGEYLLSKRHTYPMLQWILESVKYRNENKLVILKLDESMMLKAYIDEKLCFEHDLRKLMRFYKSKDDYTMFSYSLQVPHRYVTCHVYKAQNEMNMNSFYVNLKRVMIPLMSRERTMSLTSIREAPLSTIFEVVYIGKVAVQSKKVPQSFIDVAIDKFKEMVNVKNEDSPKSSSETTRSSTSDEAFFSSPERMKKSDKSLNSLSKVLFEMEPSNSECLKRKESLKENEMPRQEFKIQNLFCSQSEILVNKMNLMAGYPALHNNATLMQIGNEELTLINLNQTNTIFQWLFKDISFCSLGLINKDHFCFVARSDTVINFTCYIFKCLDYSVAEEIFQSLKHAFQVAHKENSLNQCSVCELCPMQELHQFCLSIEGLEDKENIYKLILEKIENIDNYEPFDLSQLKEIPIETCNIKMMSYLLRVYESKQKIHEHQKEKSHERNNSGNSTKENKRSFFSSLELLFRGKRDSDSESVTPFETSASSYSLLSDLEKTNDRTSFEDLFNSELASTSNSNGINNNKTNSKFRRGSLPAEKQTKKPNVNKWSVNASNKSPHRNIFIKVGNYPKVVSRPPKLTNRSISLMNYPDDLPIDLTKNNLLNSAFTGLDEQNTRIKSLWKNAIFRILADIRKTKYINDYAKVVIEPTYAEVAPCPADVSLYWEKLFATTDCFNEKLNYEEILESIKKGVPLARRGQIWQLVMTQHRLRALDSDGLAYNCLQHFDTPYKQLLNELTTHQHSILIDIGRTFPEHPLFSQAWGPGQISLFNVLKVYSLIDVEVGYCQGLSFVAGFILMHMTEQQAFMVFKHLMFVLDLRKQYRQNMVTLQVQLYQLTRLLHDKHKDLYEHLEKYDLSPTLYAAPWFVTLFTSQFSLGFVACIFDLIFAFGPFILIKTAFVLLSRHKDIIKKCQTFESIFDCLKTNIPYQANINAKAIIKQVLELKIEKSIEAYETEYHIMQEEMRDTDEDVGTDAEAIPSLLTRVQIANDALKRQKMELLDQLQTARRRIYQLESENDILIESERRLKGERVVLELERNSLLSAIFRLQQLVPDDDCDVNLRPTDLCNQHNIVDKTN